MPRRLKINTKEMGMLDVHLIYAYAGTWEEEWRPLQTTEIADLFTRVSHDVIEHALLGWSKPLVAALGRTPSACIIKLPSRECEHSQACSFYQAAHCLSTAKKMPWCFEPAGLEPPERKLVAEALRLWREGVYVVVVEETQHAG